MGRSDGRRRGERRTKGDRFVGLPHFMLRSPAWKALSPAAVRVLIQIWARYNGANNGEVSYSVREAEEETQMHRNTTARALRELVERGFLKVARESSFNLKTREARLWRITAIPTIQAKATADFMTVSCPSLGTVKNKKQSPHEDTQARYRDRDSGIETKLPATVPPQGLPAAESPRPQSLHRDTSTMPGGAPEKRNLDVLTEGTADTNSPDTAGITPDCPLDAF